MNAETVDKITTFRAKYVPADSGGMWPTPQLVSYGRDMSAVWNNFPRQNIAFSACNITRATKSPCPAEG